MRSATRTNKSARSQQNSPNVTFAASNISRNSNKEQLDSDDILEEAQNRHHLRMSKLYESIKAEALDDVSFDLTRQSTQVSVMQQHHIENLEQDKKELSKSLDEARHERQSLRESLRVAETELKNFSEQMDHLSEHINQKMNRVAEESKVAEQQKIKVLNLRVKTLEEELHSQKMKNNKLRQICAGLLGKQLNFKDARIGLLQADLEEKERELEKVKKNTSTKEEIQKLIDEFAEKERTYIQENNELQKELDASREMNRSFDRSLTNKSVDDLEHELQVVREKWFKTEKELTELKQQAFQQSQQLREKDAELRAARQNNNNGYLYASDRDRDLPSFNSKSYGSSRYASSPGRPLSPAGSQHQLSD